MPTLQDAVVTAHALRKDFHNKSLPNFGYHWLNKAIGSFVPGRICVVAGYTGGYKTTLALGMALAQTKAVYITLEDEPMTLGERIKPSAEAASKVSLEVPAPRLDEIVAILKAHHARGTKVAYIDYIQCISQVPGAWGRADEMRRVVVALRDVARELPMSIVLVSQVRRPSPTGDGGVERPNRFMLKESGDIENSADYIVMIHTETGEFGKQTIAWLEKSKTSYYGQEVEMKRNPTTGLLEQVREIALP